MTKSISLGLALVAAGLLASPADADAQMRRGMGGMHQEPEAVFRIYGMAGWTPLEVDALNARLASLPEPYSPVGEDMVVLGGGMHVRFSRFLIGGEGAVLISTDNAEFADERRATFAGFHGALMLGLSLIGTDGLDIYPLIEVGGGGASLDVQERGAPAWDEMLAQPGRSTILSTAHFFGAAGLGIDYAFRNGFLVGVRGTWNYTPDMNNWTADGDEVLGGPEVSLTGPSVRLMLGFGGRGRR